MDPWHCAFERALLHSTSLCLAHNARARVTHEPPVVELVPGASRPWHFSITSTSRTSLPTQTCACTRQHEALLGTAPRRRLLRHWARNSRQALQISDDVFKSSLSRGAWGAPVETFSSTCLTCSFNLEAEDAIWVSVHRERSFTDSLQAKRGLAVVLLSGLSSEATTPRSPPWPRRFPVAGTSLRIAGLSHWGPPSLGLTAYCIPTRGFDRLHRPNHPDIANLEELPLKFLHPQIAGRQNNK